ncbi:MAG: hypothetical protein ABI220_00885 [Candidatus Saccharimonadales bacterium]
MPEHYTLSQLRELVALKQNPDISLQATERLHQKMTEIVTSLKPVDPTHYLGREHFDAFAAIQKPSIRRYISAALFNQLVGAANIETANPWNERRIFGILDKDVSERTVTANRDDVLDEYTDTLPPQTGYNQGISRLAVRYAVQVASFREVVRFGVEQHEEMNPDKVYTRAEGLASAFSDYLQ